MASYKTIQVEAGVGWGSTGVAWVFTGHAVLPAHHPTRNRNRNVRYKIIHENGIKV